MLAGREGSRDLLAIPAMSNQQAQDLGAASTKMQMRMYSTSHATQTYGAASLGMQMPPAYATPLRGGTSMVLQVPTYRTSYSAPTYGTASLQMPPCSTSYAVPDNRSAQASDLERWIPDVGEHVVYWSDTFGKNLPAVVIAVAPPNGTVDLDIKRGAPISKVFPLQGCHLQTADTCFSKGISKKTFSAVPNPNLPIPRGVAP